MIASNTKAMTTLMLAKLVDEGKLTWETPVAKVLPAFKLGNADTTSRVLIKHLICACAGLPRQDFEWFLQYDGVAGRGTRDARHDAADHQVWRDVSVFEPARRGGRFVGGHVAYPERELGTAYDAAMASRVFGPLGMKATTFDFKRALAANRAWPHSPDVDGKPARAVMEINYAIIPVRPAGGAWSNVRDMLKYVQMELRWRTVARAGGVTSRGIRYSRAGISKSRWVRMRSTAWAWWWTLPTAHRWCTTAVT